MEKGKKLQEAICSEEASIIYPFLIIMIEYRKQRQLFSFYAFYVFSHFIIIFCFFRFIIFLVFWLLKFFSGLPLQLKSHICTVRSYSLLWDRTGDWLPLPVICLKLCFGSSRENNCQQLKFLLYRPPVLIRPLASLQTNIMLVVSSDERNDKQRTSSKKEKYNIFNGKCGFRIAWPGSCGIRTRH